MEQQVKQFGIYLNAELGLAVRISSPYWWPEGPEWVFLTGEVNASLRRVRELAGELGLSGAPEGIGWGRLPVVGG